MDIEIVTANTAERLKDLIEEFKNYTQKSSYYQYTQPSISDISITTNGTDYIATIRYYMKGYL